MMTQINNFVDRHNKPISGVEMVVFGYIAIKATKRFVKNLQK